MSDVILVVDDDPDVREALCCALQAEGHEAIAARNGAEALSTLRTVAPRQVCLVLLDLMMPVMSGFEFRKQQAADPQLAGIPVAIMSARWDARDELQGLTFLRKPMRLEEVLDVARRHCVRATGEA